MGTSLMLKSMELLSWMQVYWSKSPKRLIFLILYNNYRSPLYSYIIDG